MIGHQKILKFTAIYIVWKPI